MNFYCLYSYKNRTSELLKKAAAKRKIKFIKIAPDTYDLTGHKPFKSGDLLYRIETSAKARTLEKIILNKKVATLHKDYQRSQVDCANLIVYQKNNIATPKTVHCLSEDLELLKKQIKLVGGFPLIIKVIGGSHGKGVIKADSISSFLSIISYLTDEIASGKVVLKQFINTKSSARLIVLGNKIAGSIEYFCHNDDFRSNAGKFKIAEKKFSKKVESLAIKAVSALGLEFAGVDILIDKKGNPYLAEANFPCFFPRVQDLTGKDIAGELIDFLIKKSHAKK